jgi:hypothetical protein
MGKKNPRDILILSWVFIQRLFACKRAAVNTQPNHHIGITVITTITHQYPVSRILGVE